MWPKFLNSKLFTILISATISIILFFLTQRYIIERQEENNLRQKEDNIKIEFEKRPTFDYVDKQDLNIINSLKQHMIESEQTDNKQMELIKSMDRKIDILLSKSNN